MREGGERVTHEHFQRVRALINESSSGIVASWELLVWIPAVLSSLEDMRQLLRAGEAIFEAHRKSEPGGYSGERGEGIVRFWQGAADYLSGCKGGEASSYATHPEDCPLEPDDDDGL
jgi:hypothetical protein